VRRDEALAVLSVALLLAVMLATIEWARVDEMRGDTAIFLQSMQSICEDGVPTSEQWPVRRRAQPVSRRST